jgi:hypothetical protein
VQLFAEFEMFCCGVNALRLRYDAGRNSEHENNDDAFYFSQG